MAKRLQSGTKVLVADNLSGEQHPGVIDYYSPRNDCYYLKDCKFKWSKREDIAEAEHEAESMEAELTA